MGMHARKQQVSLPPGHTAVQQARQGDRTVVGTAHMVPSECWQAGEGLSWHDKIGNLGADSWHVLGRIFLYCVWCLGRVGPSHRGCKGVPAGCRASAV